MHGYDHFELYVTAANTGPPLSFALGTVYRHVHCAVFSEEIHCVQDIGGWRTIRRKSKEDFEMLCLRVEESKIELEKEQEELSPDELVQVTFQGETRKPPKGLVGNLLPFQTEGVSWMYHQEVKVPDMHGGILAGKSKMQMQGLLTL